MHDLKTQMALYFEQLVQRLDVDDIFEKDSLVVMRPVRPPTPPKTSKAWLYGVAAALAVLVIVGTVAFLANNDGDMDDEHMVSPSATASDPGEGDSTKGRRSLTVEGVPFSFSLPASGWQVFGSLLVSRSTSGPQGAEAVIYWAGFPEGTYADPCAALPFWPEPSSVADLATAVANMPGIELVSGPSDVTVGGLAAKHVVLLVREDVGCDPGFFYTWRAQTEGAFWVKTLLGDSINVWIVEVDGKRLFIAGETHDDASLNVAEEIQQIVASIRFD